MPRYIELRHNTWCCYLSVPKDVRAKLGTSRFYKSLQTQDKIKAEILALVQVANWKQQILDARLKLPDFLKRANDIAISGADVDLTEVVTIANVNESVAEQFLSIATKADVVFELNKSDFIDNLKSQGYAASTINSYSNDLNYWLLSFKKLSQLSTKSIRDWIKDNRAEGKTDGSISRILGKAVSKFIKYIEFKFEVVVEVDLSVPKFDINPVEKTNRKDIDNEGIGKIYNRARLDKDQQIQDFIMIAAFTGMRINEIGDLKKSDIAFDDKVRFIDIKKSKTTSGVRKIPVHSSINNLLDHLCKSKSDDDYLFDISRDAKRPTGAIVNRFSKLKSGLGFGADITFHSIRHSVDTQMIRAGIDSKIVSQIMGHKLKEGNESTKTYYHGAHMIELKKSIDKISWKSLGGGSLDGLWDDE
ncbi:hypothetical protein ETQ85_21870 [Zoogloea oleivorans]|uniref:Tyr recombinase domain-containing protein n=1 Tax=Zoogloea oleivorans TaxID=1552750 RepID=A0A6C2CIC8_9RHOO|nr:tyrosine-type recombinase/integrase [Zoogloea oleivorans]TYC53386.1 hypothetical protein ETQ85_21870 [Zoogloea oleivorans]